MQRYSRQRRETWIDDVLGGAVFAIGLLVLLCGAPS